MIILCVHQLCPVSSTCKVEAGFLKYTCSKLFLILYCNCCRAHLMLYCNVSTWFSYFVWDVDFMLNEKLYVLHQKKEWSNYICICWAIKSEKINYETHVLTNGPPRRKMSHVFQPCLQYFKFRLLQRMRCRLVIPKISLEVITSLSFKPL